MKHIHFLLLLIPITILSACTKNSQLNFAERRAIGQYKFEKVVRHHGFLKTDNLTQDYNNMILQLNDKKEAALIDQNNNNITYFGKYDIIANTGGTDDDGNTDTEYTIVISIESNGRGNQFHWVGQDASFTQGKMRFDVHRADGRYAFKLDKI